MIDLTSPKEVKAIQDSLKHLPIWHKDNMELLEQICGWYDVSGFETEMVLNKNGKRQVLATLKTILDLTPEQVAQIVSQQEN